MIDRYALDRVARFLGARHTNDERSRTAAACCSFDDPIRRRAASREPSATAAVGIG